MRHVVIRGILALIWLAAAVVSGLSGNLEWAGLYVLMGVVLQEIFLENQKIF